MKMKFKNHKDKIKLARKMVTKGEIKTHTPLFQSKAWELRKISINNRIKKKDK